MKDGEQVKKLFKKNKLSRPFAENIVVEYKNNFYKTPNISGKYLFYQGVDTYDSINNSFKIIQENFGKNCKIAPTEIFRDEEYFCIIKQEKIDGKILCKNDLKDPIIKKEVLEILQLNKKMWKEKGLFLDILGTDCIFHPTSLHNLMIYKGHIYLFDFGLLDKNANSMIFRFFSRLFFHMQCLWIEKVLISKK